MEGPPTNDGVASARKGEEVATSGAAEGSTPLGAAAGLGVPVTCSVPEAASLETTRDSRADVGLTGGEAVLTVVGRRAKGRFGFEEADEPSLGWDGVACSGETSSNK